MAVTLPATQARQTLLTSLSSDLFLLIAAHLDPVDLASLSAASRWLLRLVDHIAWRSFTLLHHAAFLLDRSEALSHSSATASQPSSLARSVWWYRARFYLAVSQAWNAKVLYAAQNDLPIPSEASSAHRPDAAAATLAHAPRALTRAVASDWHKSAKLAFAMPYLVVGRKSLIVAMRSHLYIFKRKHLGYGRAVPSPATASKAAEATTTPPEALDFGRCQVLHLNSQATPASGSTCVATDTTPGPWQDITAIRKLDSDCEQLLVGYADGSLQRIHIATAAKSSGRRRKVRARLVVHVQQTFAAAQRQEIADVSSASLTRTRADGDKAEETLLASISKRGALQIITSSTSARSNDGRDGDQDEDLDGTQQLDEWQIDNEGRATYRRSSSGPTTSTSSHTPDGEENRVTRTTTTTPAGGNRRFRSPAFNNAPLTNSGFLTPDAKATRAWSVHVGGGDAPRQHDRRWIAVGLTGDPALFIYKLDTAGGPSSRPRLGTAYALTSSPGQRTSVFALTIAPPSSIVPSYLLFAGFYDGSVRVYDTRQIYTDDLERSGTLDPITTFTDAFDDTSIYSLSFGGLRGCKLLAGNSVHARVRCWDLTHLTRRFEAGHTSLSTSSKQNDDHKKDRETKSGNWSVFTAYPSTSPQYSIVADVDRVWGVTDRKVWCLDFGRPVLNLDVDRKNDARESIKTDAEKVQGTVAFFEHDDGLLKRSRLGFFENGKKQRSG